MEEQIYKDADGELYAVKPSDVADAEAAGMVLADDAERKTFFDQDAAIKAERQQTAVAAGLAPEQVDVSVPSMEDLGLVREAAKSSGANVKRMIEGPVLKQGKPPEKPQPILDPADIEAFRNRVRDNAQGLEDQAMTALESYLDGVLYNFPTWAEGALSDHLTKGDWKNYFSPQSIQMRREENKATEKAAGIAGILTPSIGTVAKIVKPELLEKGITGAFLRGASFLDFGSKATTKATVSLLGKGIEKKGVEVLGTTLPKLEANVAQSRIVERMAFYGAKPGIIEGLKTKTGQVIIQAGVAGTEQGIRKAFEEGSRVSREATGESMGAAMLNGAISGFKEGAIVGGVVSSAAPLGIAGVRGTINLVNAGLQKINEKVTPILGSILTKNLTPIEITRAIEESRKLAGREIQSEVPALIKSLDQEYNTWRYMSEGTSLQLDNYLQKIKNVPPERKAFIEGWKQIIEDTNKQLQERWMTKTKQGEWIFDPDKLKLYLKNPEIVDGQIQLPIEIRAYREFVSTLLETTDKAQRQMYDELGIAPIASARKLLETAAEGDVALIPGVPKSENVLADILRTEAMEQNLGRQMGVLEAGRRTKFGLGEILGGGAAGSITSIALNQFGVPPQISATILGGGLLGTPLATTMFDPSATIKIMRTVDEVAIKSNEALASTSSKLVFGKTPQTLTRGFMAGSLKLAEQDRRSDNLTATYDRYAKEAGRINEMANNIDKLSEELDRGTAGLEDFPELSDISKNSMANGIKFLQSKLPKQNGQVLTLKDWKPTKRQIDDYLRYSDYVQDPTTMFLDMQERNYVPDQALEVMKAVYPSLLKEFQITLYQQLADAKESGTEITQQNRQMIDKVLGLSSEGLTPQEIKKNQDALNAPPTPKAGGKVGGGSQLEATPTQERELRKR